MVSMGIKKDPKMELRKRTNISGHMNCGDIP